MDGTVLIGLVAGEAMIIAVGAIGFGRLRQRHPDEGGLVVLQATAVPLIMVVYAVALIGFSRT